MVDSSWFMAHITMNYDPLAINHLFTCYEKASGD